MSNWTGVVTNAGTALLQRWAAEGAALQITSATVGTGTVTEVNLRNQTAVTNEVSAAVIVGSEAGEDGTRIRVRVGPAESEGYTARQIGIWAKLGSGAPALLALYQNTDGVAVPNKADSPKFAFVLYAGIALSNTGEVTIAQDANAYVTEAELEEALAAVVDSEAFAPILAGDIPLSGSGAGALFSADHTAEAPLLGIAIHGRSVQSGTPSPDSPAAIATAGGSGALKLVDGGKNLLVFPPAGDIYYQNGITYSIADDGAIVLNGIADEYDIDEGDNIRVGGSSFMFSPDGAQSLVTPLPAGDYVFSGGISDNIYLSLYDGKNDRATRYDAKGTAVAITLESGTIYAPRIVVAGGTVCSNVRVYPMLRPANIAAAYEPDRREVVSIPTPNGLPGIPVSSGGNYTDGSGQRWLCDDIDLEAGTYIRRVGTAVCDGSEDEGWTLSSNLDYMYGFSSAFAHTIGLYDTATEVATAAPHMTSWSVGREIYTYSGNDVQVGESYISGAARLWIRTNYSALSALTAALAARPMTFLFPLATPVTTALTEAQIAALKSLHTLEGSTAIYADDPALPELTVRYPTPVRAYVDGQTALDRAAGPASLISIGAESVDGPLCGLTLYGKSAQSGTPSPDSPVAITTAGSAGSVGIVCAGKNLAPYPYNQSSVTADGVSFTARSDGSVRVQGTATGNAATYVMKGNAAVKEALVVGQRYKVTTYDGGNNQGPWNDCWFQVYSGDGGVDGQGYDTFTWRGSNDCNMGIRVRNGATVDTVVYPMIRLASVDDAGYEPYVGIAATLPTPNGLPGIPVSSGGNYVDASGQQWLCDTIDMEAGTYTQRCAVLSFDGSSNSGWAKNQTDSGYRYRYINIENVILRPSDNDGLATLLCSNYPITTANYTWGNSERDGIAVDDAGVVRLTDAGLNTSGSTVADLMAKFAANPMTIVYALATPATEPLTDAQKAALASLRTHDGGTTLYTTDAAQPDMAVSYPTPVRAYIDNAIAGLKSELMAYLADALSKHDDSFDTLCMVHNDLVDGTGEKVEYINGYVVIRAQS